MRGSATFRILSLHGVAIMVPYVRSNRRCVPSQLNFDPPQHNYISRPEPHSGELNLVFL